MNYNDIKGGAHLGVMRRWIQWHALNGDTVTWGSRDVLRLKDVDACELDRLAQDIRDAVLREFKVRDTDHQYRYMVFCEAGGPAIQYADTIAEVWALLYRAQGPIMVKDATLTSEDASSPWIFHGTVEAARAWCLAQQGT